jgi:tetratricopeptide (TPR) repeat protein
MSAPASAPAPVRGGGGRQVAGYEIQGILGRGGMGVVYKARQVGLNRTVALKMILAGSHAGPDELKRFRTEAEAVARLQHPGIVQIFEVGEHNGLPFFSLEYLDGGSLDKRLDGTPMPPRTAAELVEALARAMHYAHGQGIVHRDLKPANILFSAGEAGGAWGGEPATNGSATSPPHPLTPPKITDFGLAKRIEEVDGGQTGTGSILGTPTYMAPEQALGLNHAIGPPADIYALGAILYDLLTGRPPFKGSTALDTLQMVQTAEPVPPTRLQPKLPADLQTITLKCLEKDPGNRYATAGDLADDLRRFLDDEPITARPTPAWERAWKWSKRRPTAAALAAVSALAVAGLVTGGFALAAVNADRRAVAERGEKTAQKLQAEAETNRAEAERQRDLAVAERKRATESLRGELAAVDIVLRQIGADRDRKELVGPVLAHYERLLKRRGDDPVVRGETAEVQRRVGDMRLIAGDPAGALAAHRAAEGLFQKLQAESPDRAEEFRGEEAALYANLADGLAAAHPEAAVEGEGYLVKARDLYARLARRFPDEPDYRRDLGIVGKNLGDRQFQAGRWADAEATYREARDEFDRLAQAEPAHDGYAVGRAALDTRIGGVLMVRRPADAEKQFRAAIADLTPRLRRSRRDARMAQETGAAYTNLAVFLRGAGRFDRAETASAEAIKCFGDLVTNTDDRPDLRIQWALAERELGMTLADGHRPTEALKPLRESRDRLEKLAKEFHSRPELRQMLGVTLVELGRAAWAAADTKLAEESLAAAVDTLRKLAVESLDDPSARKDLSLALNEAGLLEARRQRWLEAGRLLDEATRLQLGLVKARPQPANAALDAARYLRNLGLVRAAQDQFAEAADRYRQSAELLEGLTGQAPGISVYREELITSLTKLADLYRDRLRQPGQESATRKRIEELKAQAAAAQQAAAGAR